MRKLRTSENTFNFTTAPADIKSTTSIRVLRSRRRITPGKGPEYINRQIRKYGCRIRIVLRILRTFSTKGGYDGMLNEMDIEYIRASQDEIYELRQRPISVIYLDIVRDDFTGEIISEKEVPRTVSAVITEISIRSKDGSRYIQNGIEYEQGDIKIDVKLEYIEDIIDKLTQAEFDGKKYELLGGDKKGI